jgi:hypothetical protein
LRSVWSKSTLEVTKGGINAIIEDTVKEKNIESIRQNEKFSPIPYSRLERAGFSYGGC